MRSAIRRDSRLTKNVVGSLQTCKLDENEHLLTKNINAIDEHAESPEVMAHRYNLRGLCALLQQLLCITSTGNRSVRFSYIQFYEAFAVFLSFHPGLTAESLKDTNRQEVFKELLCHPKHGLSVYVSSKYILLRSSDVDLELFIEDIVSSNDNSEVEESRIIISRDFLQDMLNSMDSAWDKKVLKVALGGTRSRNQLQELGIGSRIQQYTQSVLETIQEKKTAENDPRKHVVGNLERKAANIGKRIQKEKFKLAQKCHKWNEVQLQEIIDDLTEQYTSVHKLLDNKSGSKNLNHMVKRKHRKLVMEKRIGMRKSGTGRPRAMDETDENYVLQCIENKATAHGHRHDSVMYLNHRVKKKDFLRLANTSRISRGLKPIRSATTVFNRARPRNRRSLQAIKHLGLGLFCSKKPPKLEDNENILTHHQRAFKKAMLMERCGEDDEEDMKHKLFISRDDKAYICPGTGTGMQSARNVKIIQPSDPSKQRVLPKYDFPERLVNATPGVNRIILYEINKELGSKDQLKITDTEVVVFNRPKNFVGSNGSV